MSLEQEGPVGRRRHVSQIDGPSKVNQANPPDDATVESELPDTESDPAKMPTAQLARALLIRPVIRPVLEGEAQNQQIQTTLSLQS